MKLIALLAFALSLASDSALVRLKIVKPRKTSFDSQELSAIDGTVLAITETSIMIQPISPKGTVRTIPLHDFLAAGKVHRKVSDHNSYRVSDLKVGDLITLNLYYESKQHYAVAICIYERPGGLVPPGQVLKNKITHHEYMNARIAFRDKGIPIPEHLIVK